MNYSQRFVALALAGTLSFSLTAAAKGNAQRGLEISKTCAACHGETGVSKSDAFPILAGQSADYLAYSLKMYRKAANGDLTGRNNAIMKGNAAALKDQDILDLAAFYAKQPGGVVHKQ